MMPRVAGVSGRSDTNISVAPRKASSPSAPWNVVTPSIERGDRVQPFTLKPSARSAVAAARLLRTVGHALPVMVEHAPDHIFGHVLRQIVGNDTHDRNVGKVGIGEDVVDARADREDDLEIRQL